MKKLKIFKIDAARRQTDQAIKLFFSNQDEVSIHSLAGAGKTLVYKRNG